MNNKQIEFPNPLTFLKDITADYKKVFEGLNQTTHLIQETLRGIGKAANQLDDFKKVLNNLVPDISKIADFTINLKKFQEEEKEVLIESGWFICPSLYPLPYDYFRRAVIKYNAGHKSSITNLMKFLYGNNNWNYLEKTVNSWSSYKFFNKQRMKIIKDALSAHKNGKYTLSIPALLPIIEGISGDFCKTQEILLSRSATTQKARETLAKIKSNGEEYLSELVLFFIENQLYVHTDLLKSSKNKKYLNRHGILHGSYSGYADCARSLRCFLLLDVFTLL